MTGLDRDAASADALLTDLYLDALLAGAVRDAAAGGSPDGIGDRLDPGVRRAADRLRRDLVRVHPSFRFEERLAARLAEAAVALRVPLAAGAEGRLVPFPAQGLGPRSGDDDADLVPGSDADVQDAAAADDLAEDLAAAAAQRDRSRPLIIGGALTTAALSLAGAAFVAWRIGRPGRAATPMARAARAVREARSVAPRARLAVPGVEDLVPDRLRPRRLD